MNTVILIQYKNDSGILHFIICLNNTHFIERKKKANFLIHKINIHNYQIVNCDFFPFKTLFFVY